MAVGLGVATGVIKVWKTTTQTSLGLAPAASLPPVGGVSAIEYRISGLQDGSAVRQRLIFTFKGAYEFPDRVRGLASPRAQIAAGCDQIVRTFPFS